MAAATKPPAHRIELVDLIDYVATQLAAAERRAKDRPNRVMEFAECELELAVSIESEGHGGFKVWVLDLGGSRTKANSHVIKVKLAALPQAAIAFPQQREGPGPPLGPT